MERAHSREGHALNTCPICFSLSIHYQVLIAYLKTLGLSITNKSTVGNRQWIDKLKHIGHRLKSISSEQRDHRDKYRRSDDHPNDRKLLIADVDCKQFRQPHLTGQPHSQQRTYESKRNCHQTPTTRITADRLPQRTTNSGNDKKNDDIEYCHMTLLNFELGASYFVLLALCSVLASMSTRTKYEVQSIKL